MSPNTGCGACGAATAADQRYCLECGNRLQARRLPAGTAKPSSPGVASARKGAASAVPALPRDSRAMVGNAILALIFGAFIGVALRPDVNGAFGAGQLVLNVPPPAAAPAAPSSGGGDSEAPAPAAEDVSVPPPVLGGEAFAGDLSSPGPSPQPGDGAAPGGGGSGQAPASTLVGTVVRANPVAHSYSVAAGGPLVAVHASKLPRPGARIEVGIDPLSNGTFAESGKRTGKGEKKTATFSGTVTFSDQAAGTYVVSSRGASVPIRLDRVASPSENPPAVGALVEVTVGIEDIGARKKMRAAKRDRVAPAESGIAGPGTADVGSADSPLPPWTGEVEEPQLPPPPPVPPVPPQPPAPPIPPPISTTTEQVPAVCAAPAVPFAGSQPTPARLTQQSIQVNGQSSGTIDLEGIVQAACGQPAALLLSADDLRELGTDLQLTAPPGFDLSGLTPGQAVDTTATLGADGAYTLSGLSSDWGRKAADDPSQALGDQAPK